MRHSVPKSLLLMAGLLVGCATQKAVSDKPYYEDLSAHRPKVLVPAETSGKDTALPVKNPAPVTPTHTVNQKVDLVLDSIDRYNQTRKFIDGFTIQVYSGQNRDDAMEAKRKMSIDLPEFTSTLQYQQPKFRLTVGRYYTKLEAHPDLMKLRRSFSSAIVVPEKIVLR
ncbi:MAG: SPOR domain-containing protein [Cytophagales bacterium]|nr:SPOR domain-containing protein [Cytophagales bacterium]